MNTEKIVGISMIIYMVITLIASFMIIFHKEYNRYDVNRDGEVNSADLLHLQKYILEN